MRNVKLAILFVCKVAGLFRLSRWMTRGYLKILCYHGFELVDESRFRSKLFIKSEQFDRRLETIKRYGFRVLPLGEAVTRLYSRTLAPDSVAITIDDGFYSTYRLAAPSLLKHCFPATVYVTTYYVEHGFPIFRLAVQYMFWKTTMTTLFVSGVPWSVERVVTLSDAEQVQTVMWDCINYGEKLCTEEQRHQICSDLGKLLGVSYADIVSSRMLHLMTPGELQKMAENRFDIQLHTHRHVFPGDRKEDAQREIADNRRVLRKYVAGHAEHFCYPSGIWKKQQWDWLDEMGIKSATTCLPGLNSHKTSRHALCRFLDGADIHPLEFEAALTGFSDLMRAVRELFRAR